MQLKNNLSFRRKIILSQIVLFVVFVAALFPFIERTVTLIVRDTLEETAKELIQRLSRASSESDMVEMIKQQEYFSFFRMSIINDKHELVYDSHVSRLLGESYRNLYPATHPEVEQALKEGSGYVVAESETFGGTFAYVAERFTFQEKTYVLRLAFPYWQLQDLMRNFEIGFLAFSFLMLLFFNALIWIIFNRLTTPIRAIVDAVRPYQTGQSAEIPLIAIKGSDEFQRLAATLNSLSTRIGEQIKSITDERNEKEAILESLGEGVIAVDAEMHVRYINFIGSKMLGAPRRAFIGKHFPPHLQKANELLISRCAHLLKTCQEQNAILTDALSFGAERKIYIDLVAAPKAGGKGAIVVLQDKSSHYKVLEMGKDFVANASHELRTPITIIKGFAETLQDLPEMTPEMLAAITEKIVRNCERMDNLVKNLLTLADIENIPESRFRECDLISMAENCRHMLLSVYSSAQVTIEKTRDKMTLEADGDLLELAIMNLMHNAAKYSKPPAHIALSISQVNENEIKITIADKGIGIPPEDLEHIFERFYTVNKAHSRKLGGAGLGLSIVKTIIDKHEGTISAESTLGEGTTFTIILPRKRH